MPKQVFGPGYRFLPRSDLLTFEEIARFAGVATDLGVARIRLTGGEPLLRRDLELLVASLARIEGIDEVTLTTNGSLLARKAAALAEAGLDRVTVSLDSLDDATFAVMNDVGYDVDAVLSAIAAAAAAGLTPIKVNVLVQRGVNDHEVVDIAGYFRGTGHVVRFIEYMDVGRTNGWRMDDVVPAAEVVGRIADTWALQAVAPALPGEVATRYRYVDGGGEIGVIASVTRPFCGDCSRLRLSAEGSLYTCLFATRGHDLRDLLRSGANDADLADAMEAVWANRDDRYSELRSAETARWERIEMSYIGG